jgi:hypothetical protein
VPLLSALKVFDQSTDSQSPQFNASQIADGARGGQDSSRSLYEIAKDRMLKREGVDTPLIVYVVA